MADTKQGTTRRNFLKIAGTAVPGAVAVASGTGGWFSSASTSILGTADVL